MRPLQKGLLSLVLLVASVRGAESQVLVRDDFEDGVTTGWTTYASGWMEFNGEYRATNTAADTPVASVFSDGFSWADYEVVATVRPLMNRSTSAAGIRFRFQAPHPSPNTCLCDLFRNSSGEPLLNLACYGVVNITEPFSWRPGRRYRLKATAVGTTVTCEVVGDPSTRISASDAGIGLIGTAGLRATHIPAVFDDFLVATRPPW